LSGLTLRSLLASFWRRQFNSRPARLGKTDSDRLFRGSGAVLPLSNVFHFFAHKLASLSAGRFAFALVFAHSFDYFFFRHNKVVSPFATRLDVKRC
jgi:hypothetical protein